MAPPERLTYSWVWEHFRKLDDIAVQCNIGSCNQIYRDKSLSSLIKTMKLHLFLIHNKSTEEDRVKWKNDNNIVWKYYAKGDLYRAKCKFCGYVQRESHISYLKKHLLNVHVQEIIAALQNEIANTSLSLYFEFHVEQFSAQCKRCNVKLDIFYGTVVLIHHNCSQRGQRLTSRQSIAVENPSTSSHYDNVNRQASGNREIEGSNTSPYCAVVMPALEESDSWMRQNVDILDNSNIQCKKCPNRYKISDQHIDSMIMIKEHLYYEHEVYDKEDRLKWEKDNDFIWGYFDKSIKLFFAKCIFCNASLKCLYKEPLRDHLKTYHWNELQLEIEKVIADHLLYVQFKIDIANLTAICERCGYTFRILETGIDDLKSHCQHHRNEELRIEEGAADNNENRVMQLAVPAENMTTRYRNESTYWQGIENQEDEQSNTSRHCADVMAPRKRLKDCWVWTKVRKLDNFAVQCNIDSCTQTYHVKSKSKLVKLLKVHLFHMHGLSPEEDREKWKNDNQLVWKYYAKIDIYKAKCKFCKHVRHEGLISNLKRHLQKKHDREIRAALQNEIANTSLPPYFEIHVEQFSARCKRCNVELDIFFGIDILINHDCAEEDQRSMSRQSIADENPSTSSHYDNINKQASGNRENEGSNPSPYCAVVMPALEVSDSWMRRNLLISDNSNIKCNLCPNHYKISVQHIDSMIMVKEHLYYEHKIYTKEDRLKWEKDDFIWGYFDKSKLFIAKCKFCNASLKCLYKEPLRDHLKTYHWNELQLEIEKVIADHLLYVQFKIDIANLTAICERCGYIVKILDTGIDDLKSHCQHHRNEELRNEEGAADNNEDRVMQLAVPAENMTTRHRNKSTYWQGIENQEDDQSTSRHCADVMAPLERLTDSWVWKHFRKLDDIAVQCNIDSCNQIYRDKNTSQLVKTLKLHLYLVHDITTEEDRSKWKNDNHLVLKYYDIGDVYTGICKFCKKAQHVPQISFLKQHLQKEHDREIRVALQNEIANKSLSRYYEIHEEQFSARCKRCNVKKDIFYGINALIHHDCAEEERLTSIAEENPSSSSHYENINRQASGNRENEGSYVGQTKRKLSTRLHEHVSDINKRTGSPSVISDHRMNSNHNFKWNEVEILDKEASYNKRLISEMIHIKMQRQGINRQNDTEALPESYLQIIESFSQHKRCFVFSNTSRHCADVMAPRKRLAYSSVWKHFRKLDNFAAQCNIDSCNQIYCDKNRSRLIKSLKIHLYHVHNISTEKDRLKWKNDNDLVWKYFDRVGFYKGKCIFCKCVRDTNISYHIKRHLRRNHIQEIRTAVQNEIANKSLSHYFEIYEEQFIARCKRCNVKKDIFYGCNALINHNCSEKDQLLMSLQEPEENNVTRKTQQSITDENPSTSSHHDNINRQTLGNRESEGSNTSRRCADVKATWKTSENWVWNRVLELENSIVQCNIDGCTKRYSRKSNTHKLIKLLKGHFFHKHKVRTTEDCLEWEKNKDLIWRYFGKVDLYTGICKFCKSVRYRAYIPHLKMHLLHEHDQEIRAVLRNEIAKKALWRYYEIHEEQFSARCNRCHVKLDIFYGIDILINHDCAEEKRLMSIAEGKPSTSSHYDNINRQSSGNRENEGR
ncbi:hypothetical protein ALC57_10754 [Trachymyrmex cornetzi]|uniref:BED-type domain-containing protein n=1 Tax=Trachymyrmex cornetzi TaxID=471704 RepID=A0A151J3G6_9HYME|nr:hypothetical protein ALC57_10754 [Trachymyrmex cornetzi]